MEDVVVQDDGLLVCAGCERPLKLVTRTEARLVMVAGGGLMTAPSETEVFVECPGRCDMAPDALVEGASKAEAMVALRDKLKESAGG